MMKYIPPILILLLSIDCTIAQQHTTTIDNERALVKEAERALIDQLEQAIAKEPENTTLHVSLGNVYDNLYQKAVSEGDTDNTMVYFNKVLFLYSEPSLFISTISRQASWCCRRRGTPPPRCFRPRTRRARRRPSRPVRPR